MVVWSVNKLGVILIHSKGLFHLPLPADGNYIGYTIIDESDVTSEERKALDIIRSNMDALKKR